MREGEAYVVVIEFISLEMGNGFYRLCFPREVPSRHS